MGVFQDGHAAVTVGGVGADDSWARADEDGVPYEVGRGGVQGADGAKRLEFAAIRRCGGDVAGEEAALSQELDVSGEGTRQRSAARLYVADPQSRRRLVRCPGRGRQVPVQRQDEHWDFCLTNSHFPHRPPLDWLDRVLEGGVVQLHHMGVPLSPALQPAREIDVDYVEAARAETQVQSSDVDDYLVALAHLAQENLIGPGAAALSLYLHFERLR